MQDRNTPKGQAHYRRLRNSGQHIKTVQNCLNGAIKGIDNALLYNSNGEEEKLLDFQKRIASLNGELSTHFGYHVHEFNKLGNWQQENLESSHEVE